MASRENIKVAVIVADHGAYGRERVLFAQSSASRDKDYGIDFKYVCLHKGYLYQKLVASGTDVEVIGGTMPKAYPPNLIKLLGVFLSYLRTIIETFSRIRAYLKKASPDLVYTHDVTLHSIGALAAKSCRIKAVGHFHLQLNRTRNWGLSRILLSWWLSVCLDTGIAISESVRDSLWGPLKGKTYIVFNGLDAEAIRRRGEQLAKRKDCAGADVVSVGRLVPIKKQDVLIRAIDILAKRGVNLDVIFVGGPVEDSNPYYVKLKEQVEVLGLSERVRFGGYVEEPHGIVAKSSVSVLCCDTEGFGIAVLEAMACKTPVIVADAGGLSELVRHNENGLKFSPDDAEQLAEFLRTIITDKEKARRLVEKAYTDVLEKFSMDSHMRQLRQQFSSIVNHS